ncbi:MAG: AI-2E family transporter [bacterium]|nr:AI-2E family transporter [bacterium]
MSHSKNSIYFILFCLAIVFTAVYFIIKPFLGPLILAAVFAFIFQPVYRRLSQFMPRKQGLAAFMTMFIAIGLVLLPVVFLGSQILKESGQLYNTLADSGKNNFIGVIENVANKIRASALIPENWNIDFNQYSRQALSAMVQSIGGIFSSFAKMVLNFFVFLMAYYYLLKDGPKLKDYFMALSPLDDDNNELILNRLKSAVSSVVKGNLLIGFIQGTLTSIGFALFGVPNPVLWGGVAAITALIPGIGTAIVIIPAVIFLSVFGNNFNAGGLLVWGIIAVGLVDNFLGPKLVGNGMRLHPLAAFLAVLGGLAFFGPLGILLGPLVLGVCLALIEIYLSLKEREKRKTERQVKI